MMMMRIRRRVRVRVSRDPAVGTLLVALVLAGGCSKPAPVAEPLRPVRAIQISAGSGRALAELPGEIRPRVESHVGFQVAGRVTARLAEVGQRVAAGQVLAKIDPVDYQLGATAAQAQLSAAQVDRDQNRADYRRFDELFRQGFISGADLDRRRAALDAAEARHAQAQAQARVSDNQNDYATLRAPAAGVVTGIDAEVGQVVAAGQGVLRIAQTDEKDVAVSLPENRLAALRRIPEVDVAVWAGAHMKGRVREIAPIADPATRTYLAKIALRDPPADVALGMSATVTFSAPDPVANLAVPLQALFKEGDGTFVWRVDPASMTVSRARVAVAGVTGADVVIGDGIAVGDTIVTAGAHLLRDGQKVKLIDGAARGAARASDPQPIRTASGPS